MSYDAAMRSGLVCVLMLGACGGSPKSAQSPVAEVAPKSECVKVADNVSKAVFTWKEPPPTTPAKVHAVIVDHCEADQWSAEAKKCFASMTDEKSAEPCVHTLSQDQHSKVMDAMEATFDPNKAHPHGDEEGAMGGTGTKPRSAPPPPPPPAKGADPCEGGE